MHGGLNSRMVRWCLLLCLLVSVSDGIAQNTWWHGVERQVRYRPEGGDFVIHDGDRRFNRALYGTNTAFRVEAGDLPEFALYLPGVGGNFQLGVIAGNESKWLTEADDIEARYRPGTMIYQIKDALLGRATLQLQVLALADAEGMVLKAQVDGEWPQGVELIALFGGANGKKFSRGGDIGADPESGFYLHADYCDNNTYVLEGHRFRLDYVHGRDGQRRLWGSYPAAAVAQVGDANALASPANVRASDASSQPVLVMAFTPEEATDYHFLVAADSSARYADPEVAFVEAEEARKKLAGRITIHTPDAHINTLGGALAVAADAIWEDPTFLHGAVAWRMRLNAWRGAYAGDLLGWSNRSRRHFESYSRSQVLSPDSAPVVMDTALHLARHLEEMGTAMFSSGYISRNPNNNTRPHHYDMNLVFFDQMLTHFNWTGDTAFVSEMWPYIKRHLAWEKRNFDTDGDGLYDAYCAIWASDALQYSGGGVTHTSAYNYRANRMAAKLARLLGEDGAPYLREAAKIKQAMNSQLWMADKGWYAEYRDLLGNRSVHENPGVWTIYHALDAGVANPFMTYRSLRYIDNHIPHIPIRAHGLEDTTLYTVSTTNWQPYTWSVNNVALAEALNTALAYWQGGRPETAFHLWRSSLIESMYLGASPGNFQQLSFYDARRGELYRDFADPIGVAARTVVEGLFGIHPKALDGELHIRPGLPKDWDHASFESPDIRFAYQRDGWYERYEIVPHGWPSLRLVLDIPARATDLRVVRLNGQPVSWRPDTALGMAHVIVDAPPAASYAVELHWAGDPLEVLSVPDTLCSGTPMLLAPKYARIVGWHDPQDVIQRTSQRDSDWQVHFRPEIGPKTCFVQLQQGQQVWWQAINVVQVRRIEMQRLADHDEGRLRFALRNHGPAISIGIRYNDSEAVQSLTLDTGGYREMELPEAKAVFGTNRIEITDERGKTVLTDELVTWNDGVRHRGSYTAVDMASAFNAHVDAIFEQRYLSPRPTSPALQLPWQGIGNWCYPLTEANIDDSGLRREAGSDGLFQLPQGIPFRTPGKVDKSNILFVSMWDNYPEAATVPLSGTASHAYLVMAGSTNPMQSQFDNAEVIVTYKDGSEARLPLRNPGNWWPIEQDYYRDGYAFVTGQPHPYRIHLKTGEVHREAPRYTAIKGFTDRAVDGGAATLLDMPLDPSKELKSLTLRALANEVVVGLMGITLKTN
ncbi:DUF4450 domain-containing protein [Parapedobacter soli]|uniref:DUF4450 domain-containing protein n=1 Tax=Parapedobacter soli TaxID=416955 RepID=UPI0021CA4349|nr:DUF4450 domain-containing protein [Parapedobacter soli]